MWLSADLCSVLKAAISCSLDGGKVSTLPTVCRTPSRSNTPLSPSVYRRRTITSSWHIQPKAKIKSLNTLSICKLFHHNWKKFHHTVNACHCLTIQLICIIADHCVKNVPGTHVYTYTTCTYTTMCLFSGLFCQSVSWLLVLEHYLNTTSWRECKLVGKQYWKKCLSVTIYILRLQHVWCPCMLCLSQVMCCTCDVRTGREWMYKIMLQ